MLVEAVTQEALSWTVWWGERAGCGRWECKKLKKRRSSLQAFALGGSTRTPAPGRSVESCSAQSAVLWRLLNLWAPADWQGRDP